MMPSHHWIHFVRLRLEERSESPPAAPPPTAPHTTTPPLREKSKSRFPPACRPSVPVAPTLPERVPRIPDRRKIRAGKEPARRNGNSRQPTAPRHRPGLAHANKDRVGSQPFAILHTVCASLQFVAKIETQSSERHAGTTPAALSSPREGFNPTKLLNAAGMRPDPAVSVPNEKLTSSFATATAEPELDPRKYSAHRTRWSTLHKATASPPAPWRTDPDWFCRSR